MSSLYTNFILFVLHMYYISAHNFITNKKKPSLKDTIYISFYLSKQKMSSIQLVKLKLVILDNKFNFKFIILSKYQLFIKCTKNKQKQLNE